MSTQHEERPAYVATFQTAHGQPEQGQSEPEFNGLAPDFVPYAEIERHGSLGRAMVAIKAEQTL